MVTVTRKSCELTVCDPETHSLSWTDHADPTGGTSCPSTTSLRVPAMSDRICLSVLGHDLTSQRHVPMSFIYHLLYIFSQCFYAK